jgi:hypothetical protein
VLLYFAFMFTFIYVYLTFTLLYLTQYCYKSYHEVLNSDKDFNKW